jgi:glucose/arabinose dehydrogenase
MSKMPVREGNMVRVFMKKIGFVLRIAVFLGTGVFPLARQGAIARPAIDWPQLDVILVESGFELPVHVAHAGDGSDRLFVVEQLGRIQIVKDGESLQEPFLDISGRVRSPFSGGGGEEGLLSVAFPPGYGAGKDHFYVYYTRMDGDNQLSRFSLGPDPDTADPNSEELILLFEHPTYSNHNGGQLVFGPDGYLYIGTGDGGGGGDPFGNAQDPGSLLGKLLRIDVEFGSTGEQPGDFFYYLPFISNSGSEPGDLPPYRIPPNNPYAGETGYQEEIWANGLRNPWRFSFDRLTGDLYIGDVGQNTREEVNYQPASSGGGENYGWPIFEGDDCYQQANCDDSGLTMPVAVYSNNVNGTCAVTGGFVYRGQAYAALQGIYFFGDYCNGTVWGLQQDSGSWTNQALFSTGFPVSSFGENESGELYLADYQGGSIYQLVEANAQSEK